MIHFFLIQNIHFLASSATVSFLVSQGLQFSVKSSMVYLLYLMLIFLKNSARRGGLIKNFPELNTHTCRFRCYPCR